MNDDDFLDWLERVATTRVDRDLPEILTFIDSLPASPEKRRVVGGLHNVLNGYVAIRDAVELRRRDARRELEEAEAKLDAIAVPTAGLQSEGARLRAGLTALRDGDVLGYESAEEMAAAILDGSWS